MEYYALFSSGNRVLVGVNDQGYPAFAISHEQLLPIVQEQGRGWVHHLLHRELP